MYCESYLKAVTPDFMHGNCRVASCGSVHFKRILEEELEEALSRDDPAWFGKIVKNIESVFARALLKAARLDKSLTFSTSTIRMMNWIPSLISMKTLNYFIRLWPSGCCLILKRFILSIPKRAKRSCPNY